MGPSRILCECVRSVVWNVLNATMVHRNVQSAVISVKVNNVFRIVLLIITITPDQMPVVSCVCHVTQNAALVLVRLSMIAPSVNITESLWITITNLPWMNISQQQPLP